MADNVLEYVGIVWNVSRDFSAECEQQVEQADNGETTSMEDGKSDAIDKVDDMIRKLQAFRMDIKKLSLKALKAKYK